MARIRSGTDARTFRLLNRAATREVLRDDDISVVRQDRRRIVQAVSRLSRLANFREQVRNAYGQRCAVTRIQLRLVDAAHILPVGAPTSVDDVRNGIALSPTFHRAYDNGLIFLDESYQMRVNSQKEAALAALDLTGGLTELKASLGRIHLPADKRQWPDSRFISKANEFRGISA